MFLNMTEFVNVTVFLMVMVYSASKCGGVLERMSVFDRDGDCVLNNGCGRCLFL